MGRQTEETILTVAKATHQHAQDNLAALGEFGVDQALLDRFQADIAAAETLGDERSERIALRQLTVDKDEALDACKAWGRRLRTRLQLAFGRDSVQVQSFPGAAFNRAYASEKYMMPIMETLLGLARQYAAELAAFGQSETVLAEGD